MTKLNPAQIAELTDLSQRILTQLRGSMRGPEYVGDTKELFSGLLDSLVRYGIPGAAFIVSAWCDTVIDATPGAEFGRPVIVTFATPDYTTFIDPRFVSNERQWAADVIAARFAADPIRLNTLITLLPPDKRALIPLFRLVEIVAHVLNEYDKPSTGPRSPGLYRETDAGELIRVGDTPEPA
jgi:hypothetical protein